MSCIGFDPDHLAEILDHNGQEKDGEAVHPIRVLELAMEVQRLGKIVEKIQDVIVFEIPPFENHRPLKREELMGVISDILGCDEEDYRDEVKDYLGEMENFWNGEEKSHGLLH